MASYPQVQKVTELIKKGYYQDADTQEVARMEGNAPGGSSYLKSPKDKKIVKVDAAGKVTPYKPVIEIGPETKPRKKAQLRPF